MSDSDVEVRFMEVEPARVSIADLRRIARGSCRLRLGERTWQTIEASAASLQASIASGKTIYGVNTGFGKLAHTKIDPAGLEQLQRNLVLSHCTGMGLLLPDRTVRLIMALKVIGLARGHSAVRAQIVRALLSLIEHEVYPSIPAKGSVGASGDLTPLAHMSAVLIGHGEARHRGRSMPGRDALAIAGLEPITLMPKEGLALLNGTQVSTALALIGLFAAEDVFAAATVAGAMSLDAAKGNLTPFDARIHQARGHPGQIDVASAYRALLAGSGIWDSHRDGHRVQDPYSLRCQPQVMGACLDAIRSAARTFEIEANAVSDNPIVFAETGDILSGGNFHAEPVGIAADHLAIAIAEIGAIAERRIALLIDTSLSDLPPFLTKTPGLNCGFMVAQISAAALASENKCLAHPATVDSIPTAANQEDHVSMATYAARRLADMADNAAGIVTLELLAAAQGLDFHGPLTSSPALERVRQAIRVGAPHLETDRSLADDIAFVSRMVADGHFLGYVDNLLPSQGDRLAKA